jgi:hypothetical protein
MDFVPLGLRASTYGRQLVTLIPDEGKPFDMGSEEAVGGAMQP